MIHDALTWLNESAFSIKGTPTSYAELFGFITGLLCVWFVARNNIWTFPIGILNAGFFLILFLDARLYADAYLQIFFIVIQVVGWYAWLKAGPNRTKLKINATPKLALIGVAGFLIAAFFILTPILREAHGSYPHWDSSTTSLSIAAQILLSFKLIENWYLWIVADLIYIPLYWAKGLYFTSVLYVLFLTICFNGLFFWRKVKNGQAEGQAPASSEALDLIGQRGSTAVAVSKLENRFAPPHNGD